MLFNYLVKALDISIFTQHCKRKGEGGGPVWDARNDPSSPPSDDYIHFRNYQLHIPNYAIFSQNIIPSHLICNYKITCSAERR